MTVLIITAYRLLTGARHNLTVFIFKPKQLGSEVTRDDRWALHGLTEDTNVQHHLISHHGQPEEPLATRKKMATMTPLQPEVKILAWRSFSAHKRRGPLLSHMVCKTFLLKTLNSVLHSSERGITNRHHSKGVESASANTGVP